MFTTGNDLVQTKKKKSLKAILLKTGVFWSLAVLVVILAIASNQFLTGPNLLNVARQVVIMAILGIGGTFVIIGGGIDLSVGSLLALASAYSAGVMVATGSLALAVLVALVTGIGFGFMQGFIITKFNVAPFAITLGGMSVFRGMTLLFTNGIPISNLPKDFRWFGSGTIGGSFPVPVLILIIVAVIAYLVLGKTKLGRYVYAIGSNENTTRLSGINVNFYRTLTYVISGVCCAIAGIVLTGRINSAHPYAGQGYELNAIAAVVIGGTSLQGGEGTIYGTIIGALIIGIIENGLNLLQINAFWQDVAVGVVIMIAVIIDRLRINLTESMAQAGEA
ncbi:ABC transporter permease [Christensenella timonensis]|uniref:ABC transporter permease n=1 Tax=Christensenella timonensis TaxID=1816678 RepID=UPI00082EA3A5|nr:ABC transporter permease [Christensenella timonensis]